jgi:hypothetical protein
MRDAISPDPENKHILLTVYCIQILLTVRDWMRSFHQILLKNKGSFLIHLVTC